MLVVLLLRNQNALESGQAGQNGAPDPDRVLPLRGHEQLVGNGVAPEGLDVSADPLGDVLEQHVAPQQHDFVEEGLLDLHVDRKVGLVNELPDSERVVPPDQPGVEQDLRRLDLLRAFQVTASEREKLLVNGRPEYPRKQPYRC